MLRDNIEILKYTQEVNKSNSSKFSVGVVCQEIDKMHLRNTKPANKEYKINKKVQIYYIQVFSCV